MKIIIRIVVVIIFMLAGFAIGFPIGRNVGFATGSEWALMQARILAREAGVFMPVNYEEGKFRVVLKQPRHLYKRAWQLADRNDQEMKYINSGKNKLSDHVLLAGRVALTQ